MPKAEKTENNYLEFHKMVVFGDVFQVITSFYGTCVPNLKGKCSLKHRRSVNRSRVSMVVGGGDIYRYVKTP